MPTFLPTSYLRTCTNATYVTDTKNQDLLTREPWAFQSEIRSKPRLRPDTQAVGDLLKATGKVRAD